MRTYISAILLLLITHIAAMGQTSPSTYKKILVLDECITHKHEYDSRKEAAIEKRRDVLRKARTHAQRYNACITLYNEYKSYQFDSAYHYAERSLHLAERMASRDYRTEAGCAMTFCLLSAGLYKEAFDMFGEINAEGTSAKYKKIFHELAIRLYYSISDYNHAQPYYDRYVDIGNAHTDSLLAMLRPRSAEWWYFTGQRQMKMIDYERSISSFKEVLKFKDIDTHTKAIATSCLAWMSWRSGDDDNAMSWFAEAAACDVVTSTKETTALCGLAEMLYQHGDMHRSETYVQQSLADANFYGARQRKIEVGNILPIIEQTNYNIMKSQRNTLVSTVAIVSVLVIVILVSLIIINKEKKKLQQARNVISESNRTLKQTNEQLKEANKIKTEYIGNSFYFNSEFIDRLEKLYRMVDRKIQARQYDDLRYSLKESTLNKERDNMYTVFDSTFLKIFPNFVEQYNSLFPESERKVPDKEMSLTTEMRIFALIRLGITESERIAKFLKYSVHTINTYKTRVKNKSLLENDLFEKSIMQIGSVE